MPGSTLIPCLRYRNAKGAISWLREAFGLEPQLVVPGEGDVIHHAQLRLGQGMVMLGSATNDNEYGKLMRLPSEAGGNTQSVYLVVSDVDTVHARAVAAMAKIVMPLEAKDYGGKGFTCLDPEGNLWSIGDYDPWNES
ncbi:VOC family protein [Piscinibacter terrae]|uniref:Glyoxalase n=1 Tax=Piscinibacter terrae TaxID=2496871 RepID=A0A3N7HQX3_9BURK|nr:VOC family protein [Albitalea terrae]RQP24658.1 glyoxalase [Albitalea terrae]